ncbi:MAG TPA: ATP-dependent helicase [Octadecabacter sp.]|nr:ATP-dependent helicase [Octadecabacter sp.]
MSIDPTLLPPRFADLSKDLPPGLRVSERVLDPVVILEKHEGRLVARLAARRTVRGAEKLIPAPANDYDWVLDGDIIRPLPKDVSEALIAKLGPDLSQDVKYGMLREQLAEVDPDIELRLSDTVLETGTSAAERCPGDIEIEGLDAQLYPYQAKGVAWMSGTANSHGGLILADEMGLGKTLQIIALLMMEVPEESAPALIICPTSLIANWVREIRRFAPSLSILVHRGPERAGTFRGLQVTNVVITTYDTMVNDISIFAAFEWSWVISDEAQAIKNPHSARRKNVATIPRRKTIPMTGTPVENSLADLWSLADFAVPGVLGDLRAFQERYPDGIETAREVAEIVGPIMIKRRVSDVAADLPERIDIDVPLEMEDDLVDHYEYVREATLAKYPVAGALVATLQLQLVCAHPWLRANKDENDEGEGTIIDANAGLPLVNTKVERALALIGEAFSNGKKILVFALFNRLGDILRQAGKDLPDAYWGAINGSTPQEDRQGIIDEFGAHEGPAILVLNPKAAGAGLNITAATVVIHMTPVWNPALEAQASARAHRRGQTLPVTIYRLYYEDTIERVMLDRSAWKNEMGNEIVPVSNRDEEDLEKAIHISPRKK